MLEQDAELPSIVHNSEPEFTVALAFIRHAARRSQLSRKCSTFCTPIFLSNYRGNNWSDAQTLSAPSRLSVVIANT